MRAWVMLSGVLVLAVPTATLAQSGPGAPSSDGGVVATARPDAPPPPLTPQEREAAHTLTLARQVYALVANEALDSDVRTLSTTLEVQIAQSMTAKDRTRARAIVDAVNESLDDIRPQISAAAVKAMTTDFTAEQLQEMLTFYQSPTGQAALRKLPMITRQSLASTLAVLPDLMQSVETDFCAKVRCSTQDHNAFQAAAARLAAARPAHSPGF